MMDPLRQLVADKMAGKFGGELISVEDFRGQTTLVVKPGRIAQIMLLLKTDPDLSFDFLVDVCGADHMKLPSPLGRFAVIYHLYSFKTRLRLRVKAFVPEAAPHIDSVALVYPAAEFPEREAYDMYGIEFRNHPDLRRILMPDDFGSFPLRKDYPLKGKGERDRFPKYEPADQVIDMDKLGIPADNAGTAAVSTDGLETRRMTLNFGPQHPSMHGTLRCVVEIDGERVVKVVPHMGFLHTGFEKLGEYRSWNQFVPVTDRMNYLSPLSNNIGYALAVEELMGIEVPPRCQYIRVIMAELSRFADHIISVGLQAMDLGAFSVMLWAFIEREKTYDLFEMSTGARMTSSYTRIGGLARDIPPEFIPLLKTKLGKFMAIIDEIEYMLVKNRIFYDRTRGVGVLSKEDALRYGATGPVLRACGVDWDLRKEKPYLCYGDLDFDVITRTEGDVLARFLVRCDEMRQCVRIIDQCIKKMPDGPVNHPDHKVTLPSKDAVYNTMEGMIHHFKLIMPGEGHGVQPNPGEIYSCSEVPNGELGFYLMSDGQGNPYRVRVRPPSMYHYKIFGKIIEGDMLSDIVATMASMNIIAGELDR